jgi:alpha-D-ribose 1-methylphosphonate 5-triphosphate synthase subunit PhnG
MFMAPRDTGSESIESNPGRTPRQRWMAVLAKASTRDLEDAWTRLPDQPDYETLRGPETGLVMVRGRIGGAGNAFNLGEMTMTRCAVRLQRGASGDPIVGFGFVAGRDPRHAELAAVFDALLQADSSRDRVQVQVIGTLQAAQRARKSEAAARAAATRVDFFTMVRE